MAAKKPAAASARTTAPATTAVATTAVQTPDTYPEPAPIEDVVGVSPVVETLTETMAELPSSVSAVVDELNKTQAEVTGYMEKAMKSAEEMVSFGQGNLEAMMKSSQILATGLQDLSKHIAASAQAHIDESVANFKALSSVKSVKEAMDLHTNMTKAMIEKSLAETGKITDASMKLAEQAIAPLTARVTLATEKFGKVAA